MHLPGRAFFAPIRPGRPEPLPRHPTNPRPAKFPFLLTPAFCCGTENAICPIFNHLTVFGANECCGTGGILLTTKPFPISALGFRRHEFLARFVSLTKEGVYGKDSVGFGTFDQFSRFFAPLAPVLPALPPLKSPVPSCPGQGHISNLRIARISQTSSAVAKNLLGFKYCLCYSIRAFVALVTPFGYVQQGCRNKLQPFVVLTAGSVQEAQTISTKEEEYQ